MAKKKIVEFDGHLTVEMLALWAKASCTNDYELKKRLATLNFAHPCAQNEGLLVEGTLSLRVSQKIAEVYYGLRP